MNETEAVNPTAVGLRGLLQRAGATLMLRGFALVFGFGTSVLLARVLGADGYGRYGYALTWATLLGVVASLRVNGLLVRAVSRYEHEEAWGLLRGLLGRADLAVLVASAVVASSAFGFAVWRAPTNDSIDVVTFGVAMLLLPITSIALTRQATLEGLGYAVSGQWPEVALRQGLFFAAVATVLVANVRVDSTDAMIMQLVATAIAVVPLAIYVRSRRPAETWSAPAEYASDEWKRAVAPMLMVGILTGINRQADIVMLGMMRPPSDVGIYTAVSRVSSLVSYVLLAANVPFAPMVARMYARGELESLQHSASRVAFVVLAGSAPLALGMWLFGDSILSLFGPSFASGEASLAILVGGQLINALAGSVGVVLLMTGHERDAVVGVGVAAVVNIVLNSVLIPTQGLAGAATATAVSTVVWNLILLAYLWRRLGIHTTAWGVWRSVGAK